MPDDETPSTPAMPAMPDMADLGGIFDSLQKVQEARSQVYEGHAGGGAVIVRATGDLEFESITIDPEVVDPADVEMLQDLVLAALHDLATTMSQAQQEAMGALGALDLGGLLGGGAIDTSSEEA
ncbi:MAG TPA: YbaB/EbfC family nucleoid-associated protein [Acidimicrobiales bacterium]|nr:YbaB/EbfC family nucleoid-associated protein [Acidimicrobiales bacterium]